MHMNRFHIKISLNESVDPRVVFVEKNSGNYHEAESISSDYDGKRQCMYTEPGLLLAGEVKLHNRQTILRDLDCSVSITREITDLAVVALCYKEWGMACLNKLAGAFSFILFDRKTGHLFAARDHLGIKQLYYKIDSRNILSISPSCKNIIEEGEKSGVEIDKETFLDYLLGLLPDQNKTVFSSILQLPPGHYFTLYKGTIKTEKYWNLNVSSGLKFSSKKVTISRFLELFEEVLRDRWGDKRRNILLFSGGLDSTSILCGLRFLAQVEKDDFELLSHVNLHATEAGDGGDKKYIQLALKKLGMETTYTRGSRRAIDETMLLDYFDENFRMPWSPLIVDTSPLESRYKNTSEKEIFSGIGGDELVSITPKNSAIYLFFSGRWYSLCKFLKREAAENGKSVFKTLLHSVFFRLLPDRAQDVYRKIRRVPVFDPIENSFIKPSYMGRKELLKFSKRKTGWWKEKRIYDPRKEMRETVESGYFIPALEHAETISQRSRCNFNMVFLDRRIIEFCLSVPGIEFARDGVPRSFLRNCMQGYLPEEIEKRITKQLIGHTDDVSMIINHKLFWSLVSRKHTSVWAIIDRKRLIAAYNDLRKGKVRLEERAILGHQISRCINAVAFYVWYEQKTANFDGLEK